MATALLRPQDRYAFIGKTRSGKTALAMVLAGTFARTLPPPWEVHWIDTKNDPKDIKALRSWGFRNWASAKDRSPESGGLANAFYHVLKSKDSKGNNISVVDQAQAIFAMLYQQRNVIVVVDEYVQVVYSVRDAGDDLLNIFQRGGGVNVGLIGLTQEPVYVPRQLISQATHICLLSLNYQNDIKIAKNICPVYVPPNKVGDPHGFYWSWVDGSGEWDYYKNQRIWYDSVLAAKPTGVEAI